MWRTHMRSCSSQKRPSRSCYIYSRPHFLIDWNHVNICFFLIGILSVCKRSVVKQKSVTRWEWVFMWHRSVTKVAGEGRLSSVWLVLFLSCQELTCREELLTLLLSLLPLVWKIPVQEDKAPGWWWSSTTHSKEIFEFGLIAPCGGLFSFFSSTFQFLFMGSGGENVTVLMFGAWSCFVLGLSCLHWFIGGITQRAINQLAQFMLRNVCMHIDSDIFDIFLCLLLLHISWYCHVPYSGD